MNTLTNTAGRQPLYVNLDKHNYTPKQKNSPEHMAHQYENVDFQSEIGRCQVKRQLRGTYSLNDDFVKTDKRINNLSELTPNKALLVHLTNYLPENGTIKTSYSAKDFPRNTLHFSINHSVTNPLGAGGDNGWVNNKYALMLPMKDTVLNNQSIGGRYNDFIFEGNVKLPEGSYIIRQNKNLKKDEVRFFDASELIEELKNKKGITLIETNLKPYAAADILIQKLGYTNLKELHAKSQMLSLDDLYDLNFPERSEYEEKNMQELVKDKEAEKHWNTGWDNFCKKYDFKNCPHGILPCSKLEDICSIIHCLEKLGSNWTIDGINYKANIISAINLMKKHIGANQKLLIDPKTLRQIIINSKTPSDAAEIFEEEYHIKNFLDDENQPEYTKEELKDFIFNTLDELSVYTLDESYLWNF